MLGVAKNATQSTAGAWQYANYLNGVDTSNVDDTLANLTAYAKDASTNLGDLMGDYTFSVDGSDEARQRAEQAQFNSYMNYMQPQFEQQTSDLATALQNKGLAVGSEAYNRAMNNLQDNQNQAINQAAYNATTAGQNAYTQSLADAINAGNFGNTAQGNYINQIQNALNRSMSGADKQKALYNVLTGIAETDYQNQQNKNNYRAALTSSIMNAGSQMAGSMMGGFSSGAKGA